MSSIDEVISRSRQPGAFVERKRFAVERSNAIRKMRQFALADPHYYALELIQSAVSNGATYLDISAQRDQFVLSYVGGHFTQAELEQLFDFLFAAQSDLSYSSLRLLALGVNAMMRLEPNEVVIESGDGTLEGTTRIVIRTGEDFVEVGTPEKPLLGTFVRGAGFKRSAIARLSWMESTDYGPPETRAIEERCITLPIPILVNNRAVFGYSSQRHPTLFGYSRVINIDEGDLYGAIGLMTGTMVPNFKLLTYGTWVQTEERELLGGGRFGGIICFDRLNKTADHAAIVHDMRYEELWLRLRPYAQQLLYGGKAATQYSVRSLDGTPHNLKALRALFAEHDFIVLAPANLIVGSPQHERALRIAATLGNAPILLPDPDEISRLRHLSERAKLIAPNLDDLQDERFLQKPFIKEPPRPWILPPQRLDPMTRAEVLRGVCQAITVDIIGEDTARDLSDRLAARWIAHTPQMTPEQITQSLNGLEGIADGARHRLPTTASAVGIVKLTLYTPAHSVVAADEVLVRLISSGRLLWAGRAPSAWPGLVLVCEIDDMMPRGLEPLSSDPQRREFGALIVDAIVHHIQRDMARVARAMIDNLENMAREAIEPGNVAAQSCLSLLGRDGLLRMRPPAAPGETPTYTVELLEPSRLPLLDLPLLRALSGEPRSLHQVLADMSHTHGLVYGVVDAANAQLEGLDTSRLLALNEPQERLLIRILGLAAYVRLDSRDTLAMTSEPQRFTLRDIALGLRQEANPNGTWLSEEGGELRLDAKAREAIGTSLLRQLFELFSSPPQQDFNEEDQRRQALRHIHTIIVRRHLRREPIPRWLLEAPLFVDLGGARRSFDEVLTLIHSQGAIPFGDGRAHDVLSAPRPQQPAVTDTMSPPQGLAMNPFLAALLAPIASPRPAFDFTLTRDVADEMTTSAELEASDALVTEHVQEEDGTRGVLSIPHDGARERAVLVIEALTQRVSAQRAVAQQLGVLGFLRLSETPHSSPDQLIYASAQRLHERLLSELPSREQDESRWARACQALLTFASEYMTLALRDDGHVVCEVRHTLARRILDLPIFDSSAAMPLSGWQVAQYSCQELSRGRSEEPWRGCALDQTLHPALMNWLRSQLTSERVVALSSTRRALAQPAAPDNTPRAASADDALERALFMWLAALRPDDEALHALHVVQRSGRALPFFAYEWGGHDATRAQPFLYHVSTGERATLLVDCEHWLVSGLYDAPPSARAERMAWLLLATYAHINELLEPVTNAHEQQFQVRVLEALAAGELDPERMMQDVAVEAHASVSV